MARNPYDDEEEDDDDQDYTYDRAEPPVIMWFKVYTIGLALLYVLTAALSVAFFFIPDDPEVPPGFFAVFGVMLLVMSLGLIALCLLPLFVQRKPWVWTYNLILICLGMTGCTFPVCIPLLIYWLKPETKRYYGKRD